MKTVIKASIYVAVMTVIIVLLNHIVPNPYEKERDQVALVANNFGQYQSLTFGRSHALSVDYNFYKCSGMNFALGGRDLASIEYLMDFLLPRCDSLKEVLLFISYTSLYFDNTAMSQGNLNDARKALYYSVPLFYPIEMGDINNFIFGKFFTFIQADHGWQLIKDAISGKVGMDYEFATEGAVLTPDEMEKSGERQATRDILDAQTASRYNPNVAQDNEYRLHNVIKKCQQRGLQVFLIQAPYFYTYTERVPQKLKSEVDSVVNRVAQETHLNYFDYSNNERFSNDITLWNNADHLNREGRVLFTKMINDDLK